MTVVKNTYKDAFVLRVPLNAEKVSSVVVFRGDGSRKFPHSLIRKYVAEHADQILSAFPEDTPILYGDLEALLGRFARWQPSTIVESGEKVTVVTTGTLRTVIDTENFQLVG